MATARSGQHLWIVGGGIAGMAAAAFAIRDGNVPGANIHILEELGLSGGSMDGAASPVVTEAYVTRGGRMFEEKAYQCVWNLFDTIPSLEDPYKSVRQEMLEFNDRVRTDGHARLIDANHRILEASDYGFSLRDRADMSRLISTPESWFGSRRIDEVFNPHFFTTNFWQCWRTTFAFQKWHSAVEMRRYCLRFLHVFEKLSHAQRRPAQRLQPIRLDDRPAAALARRPRRRHPLRDPGHRCRFRGQWRRWSPGDRPADRDGSRHRDAAAGAQRARHHDHRLDHLRRAATAELTTCRNSSGAASITVGRSGSTISKKAPDFGRPMAFYGNIDEHKWESFTLTMHGDTLLKRIIEYSGNEPGTGALMTWIDSGWHLSIVVPHQPHFPNMPPNTYTIWGYGFELDRQGTTSAKTMSEATGREILIELIRQLGFDDILDEVLATTEITTVMMPYASALFACRKPGDRPKVVPGPLAQLRLPRPVHRAARRHRLHRRVLDPWGDARGLHPAGHRPPDPADLPRDLRPQGRHERRQDHASLDR